MPSVKCIKEGRFSASVWTCQHDQPRSLRDVSDQQIRKALEFIDFDGFQRMLGLVSVRITAIVES